MIVLDGAALGATEPSPSTRGRRYRASFSEESLPAAVSGVWRYLDAARRWPVELELLPGESGGAPPIEAFPDLEPTDGRCEESVLVLRTSGTTGEPKAIRVPIADRYERTRGAESTERWILAYAPFRWAGISVLLHVLKGGAQLAVGRTLAAADILETMRAERCTHVSWTPSLFRHFQLVERPDALRRIPLRQITFGGEYATQDVLDRARALWPEARVSHVYAMTEYGDLWSVSDGRAGCPEARFLRAGFALTDDGELVIDGRPTGDFWNVEGGRYVHDGRREDVISVGGAKVSAVAVESAALGVSGVLDARAYPVPSPLLGQLVGLEYAGSIAEDELRAALADRLPRASRPAEIVRTETIRLSAAHKKARTSPHG